MVVWRLQDPAPPPEASATAQRTTGQEHAKPPASSKASTNTPAKGEGAEKKKSSTAAKRRGKMLGRKGKTKGEGGKDTLDGRAPADASSCGVRLTGLLWEATAAVTAGAAAVATEALSVCAAAAGAARDRAGAARRRNMARRSPHGSEPRVVWLCGVVAVVVALLTAHGKPLPWWLPSSRLTASSVRNSSPTLSAQMGGAIEALRRNVGSASMQQTGCRDIWSLSLVHRGEVADLRLAQRHATAFRDALMTHSRHAGVQETCCGAVANLGADNADAQVLRRAQPPAMLLPLPAVARPFACATAASGLSDADLTSSGLPVMSLAGLTVTGQSCVRHVAVLTTIYAYYYICLLGSALTP